MKRIFGLFDVNQDSLRTWRERPPTKTFDTALHRAVLNENLDIMALLVWNSAKADARTLCERTTLHLPSDSISPPRAQIVRVLLEAGADKDVLNRDVRTPLHWAARNGDINIISILLDLGAHIEAEYLHETRALYYAFYYGWPMAFGTPLNCGALLIE